MPVQTLVGAILVLDEDHHQGREPAREQVLDVEHRDGEPAEGEEELHTMLTGYATPEDKAEFGVAQTQRLYEVPFVVYVAEEEA